VQSATNATQKSKNSTSNATSTTGIK